VDLSQSQIHIKLKVLTQDGGLLQAGEKTTLISNSAHSIFEDVQITLNDRLCSQTNHLYPFLAYTLNTLSYGATAKSTWLAGLEMYHSDSGGTFHTTDPDQPPINAGLIGRSTKTAQSKTCELLFRPLVDLFLQPRPIAADVDIRIKLTRSPSHFCLVSAEDNKRYMVKITHAVMYTRMLKVDSSIASSHQSSVNRGISLKYPIIKNHVVSYSIPSGTASHFRPNFHTGRLPKRVILMFNTNIDFCGSYASTPFHFRNFNISQLSLRCNGEQIPGTAIETDFTDTVGGLTYARAYETLFSGIDKRYSDSGPNIDIHNYREGYTFFCLKIAEDYADVSCFGTEKSGNISLEIRFHTPLAETINCISILEFQNLIQIKKNGEIETNFTV
jgi:hypothetical protein